MSDKKDAIDVEFETIVAKKPPKSDHKIDTFSDNSEENNEQLTVFGKRKKQPQNKPMPLPIFTLVAAVCAVGTFYLAGGHTLFSSKQQEFVVEAEPDKSAILPEQKLQISDITTNTIDRDNVTVMTIRATITNTDNIARPLPAIIVRLGDDTATSKMFRINRGEILKPGERLVFTNSLPVGNAPTSKPELSFAQ